MCEIRKFRGEYGWLSNFHDVEILYKGYTYPSVEHAFVSGKNDTEEWKEFCSDIANDGAAVKRAGRYVDLVSDWNTKRIQVMRECLIIKFQQEPYRTKLINTGDCSIIEGNTWGDSYWGFDEKKKKGKNYLGRLIMEIRDNLNSNNETKNNSTKRITGERQIYLGKEFL